VEYLLRTKHDCRGDYADGIGTAKINHAISLIQNDIYTFASKYKAKSLIDNGHVGNV
jgi:hypothetical protein